eukprot:4586681-Lingulodinium_polyedra.AAC.1
MAFNNVIYADIPTGSKCYICGTVHGAWPLMSWEEFNECRRTSKSFAAMVDQAKQRVVRVLQHHS